MSEELTVEALRYYVPLFKKGDAALLRLQEEDLDELSRNLLETQATVRDIALDRLIDLTRPLMISEINKAINSSILKGDDEGLFNQIFYAGVDGMIRGLRKFEVEKIESSATNYLFQWITTYAKKELLRQEAPFGIAPSRFYKYKKISAVRRRMEDALGRSVTNQEVLDYFHGGEADIKTMYGRLGKPRASAANRAITLELVEEQEEFEHTMKKVVLIDSDDFRSDQTFSYLDKTDIGALTLFVEEHREDLTLPALAYISSELGLELDTFLSNFLKDVPTIEYRSLGRLWQELIMEIDGPFHNFLKELEDIDESGNIMRLIEENGKQGGAYESIFRS